MELRKETVTAKLQMEMEKDASITGKPGTTLVRLGNFTLKGDPSDEKVDRMGWKAAKLLKAKAKGIQVAKVYRVKGGQLERLINERMEG